MQNATHTFQQLSQQHLGQAAGRHRLTQMLEKVKERVLKVRRGSLPLSFYGCFGFISVQFGFFR